MHFIDSIDSTYSVTWPIIHYDLSSVCNIQLFVALCHVRTCYLLSLGKRKSDCRCPCIKDMDRNMLFERTISSSLESKCIFMDLIRNDSVSQFVHHSTLYWHLDILNMPIYFIYMQLLISPYSFVQNLVDRSFLNLIYF